MEFKKIIKTKEQFMERLVKEFDSYKENYRKCYFLAYNYCLERHEEEGIKMVVASMYEHRAALQNCIGIEFDIEPYYVHAFVEMNSICYEPVLEMYFTKELFYELFKVKVRNEYTPLQAYLTAIKYGCMFFDWGHARKDRTRKCDLYNYPEEFIEWAYRILHIVFRDFLDDIVQRSDELSMKIEFLYQLRLKDRINIKYLYKKYLQETQEKSD